MSSLKQMMEKVSFAILSGHNYRPLHKWNGISRIEFKNKYKNILEDAEKFCKEQEGTEEDILEVHKEIMRQLAESNLFFFCTVILNMEFADNDYVYRLCMDVQDNKWNRIWIIAREHFKTTIITESSTLWELVKNPELTYLINSYNESFSQTCVEHIKTYCETCPLLYELWPNVFWKDPAKGFEDNEDGSRTTWTWTKSKIELKRKNHPKEMTIESGAIEGAGSTGGHFARIIYDDAETPKTVETIQSIDKAYAKIMLAVNTGKTADLNICFVGTFYARDDLYVRMIKNKVVPEAVIQPCCEDDGTPIHYSEEDLLKKCSRMGIEAAMTQMFCDPSVQAGASFQESWLKFANTLDTRGQNVYIICDPAGGKQKKRNDNTAMIVVGIDNLGNMVVHHMIRDKLTDEQKFSRLVALYIKYLPIEVLYEEESMQADIALLNNYMDKYNTRFGITPFSMKKYGSKEKRIIKLATPFSQSKIWLPRNCWNTNYLGKAEDVIHSFIVEEYMSYPLVQHDDVLDALATIYLMLEAHRINPPLLPVDKEGDLLYDPVTNRLIDAEYEELVDSFEDMA